MNTNEKEAIERYVEAVIRPRISTDNEKYPIRDSRVNHMFLAEYASEFISDLNELKSRGYSAKDIGLLFCNPTRLMRMIHLLQGGAKGLGYSASQQQALVLELLGIIESIKYGSIYNEDNRNILLSPKQVDELLAKTDLVEACDKSSAKFHRFCGLMWSYSEAPYFVAHDVGMEQHGLYEHDGVKILVRDFMNLRPTDLWEECRIFPLNKIKLVCAYKPGFEIDFDVFYNTFATKGNPVNELVSYAITADDRPIDLSETDAIVESASKVIKSISEKIDSWSMHDIARKYAEVYWYRKRPLADALGKDWRPPKKVFENIEAGEIKPERTKNLTPEQIRESMALI